MNWGKKKPTPPQPNVPTIEQMHERMEKLDRQSATVVVKNPRFPLYVVVKLADK